MALSDQEQATMFNRVWKIADYFDVENDANQPAGGSALLDQLSRIESKIQPPVDIPTLAKAIVAELPASGSTLTADQVAEAVIARLRTALGNG